METLPPSPLRGPSTRIYLIDALRGFALFGILLVHISMFFYAGMMPEQVQKLSYEGAANIATNVLIQIFISGKFFTIFSFLFGLSFAIQLLAAEAKGQAFAGRFAWRLVLLGLIGLAHQLVWRGDILMIYALLGFVLLALHRAGNGVLLWLGLLLFLNVPILVQSIVQNLVLVAPDAANMQPPADMAKRLADEYGLFKSGNVLGIMAHNFKEIAAKAEFQVSSGRLFVTLGCFLLGLYAGRKGYFHRAEQHRDFFKKLFKISGFTVLGCIGLVLAVAALSFAMGWMQNGQMPNYFAPLGQLVFDVSTAALTLWYIAAFVLLYQKPRWQARLQGLVPVGKMGLSTYLGQSLIGVLLFYGYGLGLLGHVQAWQAVLLAFPVFALQWWASRWWLAHYQYGPVEWLWRSLTYGTWQPLRRRP